MISHNGSCLIICLWQLSYTKYFCVSTSDDLHHSMREESCPLIGMWQNTEPVSLISDLDLYLISAMVVQILEANHNPNRGKFYVDLLTCGFKN